MRISFNVDDTLVLHDPAAPKEVNVRWYWRWLYNEPMRLGTKALLQALIERKCEICLYTTSIRRPRYLRGWFKRIGIPLADVIDVERHEQTVGRMTFPGYTPSKYPPAFGINLHVDESEGVAEEGRLHGFEVLVISPADLDWTRRVLEAVDAKLQKT